MNINFRPRELDWLNNYAGNREMSVEAAVRQAVRWLSIIEGVPGAREAVVKLMDDKIGPKYEPMPPLPADETSPARVACGADIGFGMKCRRERGHEGFHTWDPKTLLGEEPV